MTNKTGVEIKETKLLDKKVKADFKKIFAALSKALLMFKVGAPRSAIKEAVSIIEAFKFKTDASDLAYQLVMTALVNSAHQLAEENSHLFQSEFEEEEKLYDDKDYQNFLDEITNLIKDKEIILEFETLKAPRSLPILEDFQKHFVNYLLLFGVPKHDADLIGNRLNTYFVFELNDEWRRNYTKYEPLLQNLNAPTAEAARKERQWEAYYSYLEREVEKSVFGESFGLKDIFIPLRGYYKQVVKEGREVKSTENIVISIEETFDKWLDSTEEKDTIKIVQGGPGSGKSSFVKWWVAKIARKDIERKVLFFPLHHFNIHTSIKAAVGEYFKDADHISLEFNPLEETKHTNDMLLVFDGLDELVMQGKSSKETANAFLQEIKAFCGLKNNDKQRFKVVVTGRPIAIQDTEAKLRGSNEQILYLLPYYLTKEQQKKYIDKNNLLEIDQRNEWWNKFYALKNLSNRNLPKELMNPNMDKITTEPLLNYLVALSWLEAPEKFNTETNINDVYNQLILGVYNRDWEKNRKHKGQSDLTPDDFIQILEEIAICAWQGGDARVTTERKIETHIKGRGLAALLEEYKASAKGGVSRLLTAFYFRKFGKEDTESKDDTFEFTHKSFGEYLAARAIVELIQATHEEREDNKRKSTSRRNKRKGWTIQQALGEWLRVTGNNPIDENLNQFIINEISIRKEKGEPIEQWQTTLSEVISEMIITGIPLHTQERLNHLEEIRIGRNTEEAILVALADCARVTDKISNIESLNPRNFPIWLNRLSTSFHNNDFAFKNLNHLNFYFSIDGFSLPNSNFSKSNLSNSQFGAAFLDNANFSDANLEGVSFFKAYVGGVNFNGANLTGANFHDADLYSANLENANLYSANLENANLYSANLKNARNLTFKQLLKVKSLYETKGIPPKMKEQLMKEASHLFENPYKEE